MDKISSLLEESSDPTLDPFGTSDSGEIQAGVVPPIQKSSGLGESTSVSRSSGFYSIQKPKRKPHRTVRAKTDPKLIQESKKEDKQAVENPKSQPRRRKISGTYSMAKKNKPIRRDRVSSKSLKAISPAVSVPPESMLGNEESVGRVSGSYQYVKSKSKNVRSEEVKLASNVSAPRPAGGRLKRTFEKILGKKKDPIDAQIPSSQMGTSGEQWLEDKPEGDKYWTVAADDSQRDDHSIWTLLLVFVLLSVLGCVLVWFLLGYSV